MEPRGARRMVRIVIADDHQVVRLGLMRMLENEDDIKVVGEASNGRDAVEICRKLNPDLIVLDYSMPEMDGLEATRQIAALKPPIKILILTMYDSEEYANRLLKAGASGFILKADSTVKLPDAIRKVMAGEICIAADIMEKVILRRAGRKEENPIAKLSDRELQVLIRVARGSIVREISKELGLSENTVKTYAKRIREKLGLRNMADLTRFAIKHDLVDMK